MSNKKKSTATKEDTRPVLEPTVRFPEFRDDPGWKQVPLDQLASRVTTKNVGGDCTRVLTNSAERGVLDQRDYFEKDIATAGNLEGYYVVNRGDYVYNPRISNVAPVGPISRNNIGQGVMSPLYTVFRFNSEDTDFYSHYFKTTCWHSYLRQVASMGARHDRMSISVGDFVTMPLPALSPAEQQKIAECLNSVDELIAAQARNVDALKTHKKGLMQQLFPREGETQPHHRFPEFREDWILKTGENITTKITKGSSPSWQGFSYQSEGVLFITSENVRDGFLDVSRPKYLPNEFYEKQKNSQLCYGDILINIVGASIGRNCLYLLDRKAFTNQAVALFRVDNKNSFDFINFCYQHDRVQLEVSGRQSDSARPNLSLTDLNNMKFILPSLPEQQKIADCLTSLDDLIAAQTQKLDALKAHKQGLMQKLFPSPEEVEE